MSPVETAKEFFGGVFYEIVDYFFENGFAYCGPDAFALAMPHSVNSLMGLDLNNNVDICDCWLVQYVAGDLSRLLALLNGLPQQYEFIVFERDDEDIRFTPENKYKVYKTNHLISKLERK
jgi:hypothetical protein